ncbi:ParB/RepB/Spo0J family partition protein [Companilactobacillus sp.]|uniref:ParB/RepB/Spo0J family partition protein n=1 Tax=Companilactobacillus sp. TaxID=2767905 RepID=UPI0025C2595C|nr:ParB/RepB/Spo0J family partition protein [Companilactobacillus sp.]MCH4009335.1 ParB/RepB/Spo0J family partition protein [Companilactobacillus sp.]MCH4050486.1 ParB/RepB/Spo0J family partition protein [Companilactobacillus sp.]MCH4077277.1 ParB/RepB/Spo0J family partition protein [Companilactobacillus sp.]MCH4125853.1 ParB/RepB/Spo0J family partition protein [Companilactobacillus sp.]MCI1311562.1 ParB/RepB/Spo0J family partition protein [Companilactobacillus sp.]
MAKSTEEENNAGVTETTQNNSAQTNNTDKTEDEKSKKKVSDNGTRGRVIRVSLDKIIPNRYQPRTEFDKESIDELSQTISEHGLLQPMVVRSYEDGKYEIIAGERRFRALKKLNWHKVPVIVKELDDEETASMALIENVQRENLNPVEEARAYRKVLDAEKITQSELAKRMSKSQSYVANKLRLLALSDKVLEELANEKISTRHGRELLRLSDKNQQDDALNKILKDSLNVKETKKLVDSYLDKPEEPRAEKPTEKPAESTEDDSKETPVETKPKTKPGQYNVNTTIDEVKQNIAKMKKNGTSVSFVEDKKKGFYEIDIRIHDDELEE